MDDIEDHECEGDEPVVRPWSWMHLVGVTANLAGNVSKSLWAFFDDIKDAAQSHVAVGDDVREAYASLHRDLESLPSTDE